MVVGASITESPLPSPPLLRFYADAEQLFPNLLKLDALLSTAGRVAQTVCDDPFWRVLRSARLSFSYTAARFMIQINSCRTNLYATCSYLKGMS